MKNVFIIGSKGIPANYGGFETFVEYLTKYKVSDDIKYHVACLSDHEEEFEHNQARCFKVQVPNIGPAKAVYYDIAALKAVYQYVVDHNIEEGIVYILACRIGPFLKKYVKMFHTKNIQVFVNPDGHEFKRAKWNWFIRQYWKLSERLMIKNADYVVCDSQNIEKYIQEDYKKYQPQTTFIAYGADLTLSKLADDDEKLVNWYKEKGLTKKGYYLVVGRFVPENSFEVMIREFMKSKSKKNFAIITNVNDKFLNELEKKLHFKNDKRIKFVGTVYDQELLKKIRENAYAYFHGHTVGGTNPSLIEALGSTDLNLLVDVGFNKEVAEDCALYWSRKPESLAKLIDKADLMSTDEIAEMGRRAKKRVAEEYTWDKICGQYEDVFVNI